MKQVAELYVYPIKSCKGIKLDEAALCPTGFRWDRQWLIVNDKGRMITQRVEPKLALIEPIIPPNFFVDPLESLPADPSLCLKAPGMEMLKIPLLGDKNKERVDVSVWDWSGVALYEGPAPGEWLSKYLGKTCHLLRYDTEVTQRATNPQYANGYNASFSDGYPFLIISQESLEKLNSQLEYSLPINRFRPNIVVKGCEPFEEDRWQTFRIGELTFHGVKICARCKVPTINQDTGEMGMEPALTLQKFRKGEMLTTVNSAKNEVYFGQNAVCEECATNNAYSVRVGDPVQVVEVLKELSV